MKMLQIENCFVTHIEQQVEDAEVGNKAVTLGIYLVIWLR